MRARDVLDWLAPPRCLACAGAPPAPLCAACEASIHWCAPGEDAVPPGSGLDRCVTALWLEDPVASWIHRFKYPQPGLSGLDGPARALGLHLARRLAPRLDPRAGDRVVPVPLHPRRQRERGFDQAGVIAREAFRGSGARLATGGLRRIRDTPRQTDLGRAARHENVARAFAWAERAGTAPRRVWLVDDVVTTGATLGAAAAALRAAGTEVVIGVGLARTPAASGPAPGA